MYGLYLLLAYFALFSAIVILGVFQYLRGDINSICSKLVVSQRPKQALMQVTVGLSVVQIAIFLYMLKCEMKGHLTVVQSLTSSFLLSDDTPNEAF